jgi:hypothetical protein
MRLTKGAGLVLLLAVVVLSSCTSFELSGAQVTKQIPSYTSVGTFDITVPVHEFLGGSAGINLFNVTADAMDTEIYDAIQREIQKFTGDAAVNVTVTYRATFVDILLNAITLNIYAPAHAQITGTIVKYSK